MYYVSKLTKQLLSIRVYAQMYLSLYLSNFTTAVGTRVNNQ